MREVLEKNLTGNCDAPLYVFDDLQHLADAIITNEWR
jgi:hypothetical protein